MTPRKGSALGLVARGMSNAEIAAALTLSEATVKTHVARILTKLGVRDRIQAVVLAYETGVVSAGSSLPDSTDHNGARSTPSRCDSTDEQTRSGSYRPR